MILPVSLYNHSMAKEYKPLPDGITIKKSDIPGLGPEDGLGLFATRDFPKGHNFGISHVKDSGDRFHLNLIRLPLGGFINHSTEPNCEILEDDEFIYLISIKDLKAGDELLMTYPGYDPTK